MSVLTDLSSKIQELFNQAGRTVHNAGQSVSNFMSPPLYNPQASVEYNKQVARATPGPAFSNIIQKFPNISLPKFQTGNQITSTLLNIPGMLAEGFLNTPKNSFTHASQLGENIADWNLTPQRAISHLAGMAELPLMVGGGETAVKTVADSVLNKSLGQAIIHGGINGLKYGAGFGTLAGLQENINAPTIKHQLINTLPSTISGGVTGLALGGATAGLSNLPRATIEVAAKKLFPKSTPKEVAKIVDNYLIDAQGRVRNQIGQFAVDKAPWIGQISRSSQAKLDKGQWTSKNPPKVNAVIDEYLKANMPQAGLSVKYTKDPLTQLGKEGGGGEPIRYPNIFDQDKDIIRTRLKGFSQDKINSFFHNAEWQKPFTDSDKRIIKYISQHDQLSKMYPDKVEAWKNIAGMKTAPSLPQPSVVKGGVKVASSKVSAPIQPEPPILQSTPTGPQETNTGLKVSNPTINAPASLPSTPDYIKQLKQTQQRAGSVDKGGVISKGQNLLADIKRKLVDSTAPIEDILASAQKKGKFQILPSKNISMQIDRSIRSNELAGQFLKDNGMVDVIRQVPDINTLDQYLIAKHAPEVEKAGFKTGRNAQADAKLVQDLAPTYEPYAQAVVKFGQNLLDKAVETGLVSQETANTLRAKYPNYVPLNRIFNELEQTGAPSGVVKGVASLSKQTVVQKLQGSERAIKNPIESLLTKTMDVFSQGERNQAGQMLASYKDLPGNPFQLRELAKGESGVNTISYLDNGVKRTFETTPEVAQAAKFLDKRQLGLVGQIFSLPVRIARVGITGINIPFIASNFTKDQVSAFINSDKALKTSIVNPVVFGKSLWTAVGHGAEFDNWIRNAGGGTSFDISRSAPQSTISQIRSGRNVGSKALYTVTHPAELLRTVENIVSRGEELTRLQQFIGTRDALLKAGRTGQDANLLAAKASRENTVNFGRSGDWGKALNSVFLYMNAGIQGSRTLLRNLQTKPLQTATKIGLSVYVPLATVTAWNLSDPQRKAAYDDIRDFEKENNLVIVPPNPTKDANGKWNVIKVPYSQEVANLTIPVRKMIEGMQGENGASFTDFASAILGSATSLNTQSPNALVGQFIPQGIKPELEALLNKNLFTGTDIVPQYINGKLSKTLPPSEQVQDNTSGTARIIGGALNASPMKVEQFVKSAAGGVGSQLLNTSDQLLAKAGVIPPSQIGGQSISQGLTSRFTQATGGQDLTKLYNQIDQANTNHTPLDLNQQVVQNGKVYYPTVVQHKDGTTSYTISSDPATATDNTTFGKTSVKQFITPKALSDDQFTKEFSAYVKDDLGRSATPQEIQTALNDYHQGQSLADIQINRVASTDEAVGFKQTPQQKQQTLQFLQQSKQKTLSLTQQIYGDNARLNNLHQVGSLVESGASDAEIVNTLKSNLQTGLTGQYTVIDKTTGKRKQIDLSTPIIEPKLTGLTELDKKSISSYNSDITSRVNDIYALYKDNQLTADQANAEISKLKNQTLTMDKNGKVTKGAKGKAAKKPKKVTIKTTKLSAPKLTFKSSTPKVTPLKIKGTPAIKYSAPKKKTITTQSIHSSKVKAITVKGFRNSLTT